MTLVVWSHKLLGIGGMGYYKHKTCLFWLRSEVINVNMYQFTPSHPWGMEKFPVLESQVMIRK